MDIKEMKRNQETTRQRIFMSSCLMGDHFSRFNQSKKQHSFVNDTDIGSADQRRVTQIIKKPETQFIDKTFSILIGCQKLKC